MAGTADDFLLISFPSSFSFTLSFRAFAAFSAAKGSYRDVAATSD